MAMASSDDDQNFKETKRPGIRPQYMREPLPEPLPNVQRIRHHRNLRHLAVIVTPLLLIAAGAGYMASPLSKVQNVTVKGTNVVANQDVIDASGLNTASYIPGILLNETQIEQQIEKKQPAVKDAKITVVGTRNVTIRVQEYGTVGYVVKNGTNHELLSNGTVMAQTSGQPAQGLPLFTGFDTGLRAMIKVIAQVPSAIRQDISEVSATRGNGNPYQVTLTMNDGNTIVADSRTLVKKIKYYPSIVKQVKGTGTVDLEVGAYFVPKNKK